MNSIINSDDFKKDKYLFSLVSHNLEYDILQLMEVLWKKKNYYRYLMKIRIC